MSEFWKDADDIQNAVVKMFEMAKDDPEVAEKTKTMDALIVYKYHDPDAQAWLDTRGGEYKAGSGDTPGDFDIRINCSADDGHRAWSSKLNTAMAMTRKKLKIEGNMPTLMKMSPILKNFTAAYLKVLPEIGKEDIILK